MGNNSDEDFLNRFIRDDDDDDNYDDEKIYYEEDDSPAPSFNEIKKHKKKLEKKSKKDSANGHNKTKIILYSVSLVICTVLVTFFCLFSIKNELFSKGKVGVKAVYALYNFKNIDELESNLDELSIITTDEVFKKIAVTNSDKSLSTYLKFKDGSVKVEILESKPGYVLYTLDSSSLSSGRKFMFSYTLNWFGKIDSAREMECIDFY